MFGKYRLRSLRVRTRFFLTCKPRRHLGFWSKLCFAQKPESAITFKEYPSLRMSKAEQILKIDPATELHFKGT